MCGIFRIGLKIWRAGQWTLNDTYRFINIGILVKSSVGSQGNITRNIEQIGAFDRGGDSYMKSTNKMVILLDQGELTGNVLPSNLRRRFEEKELPSIFLPHETGVEGGKK